MLKPIRRVVTGHDAQGRSIIASDAASPNTIAISETPAFGMTDLWVTHGSSADHAATTDPAARRIVLEPPPHGTIERKRHKGRSRMPAPQGRNALSFTQAMLDRIFSTFAQRAGDRNVEPDSTMGTPTIR